MATQRTVKYGGREGEILCLHYVYAISYTAETVILLYIGGESAGQTPVLSRAVWNAILLALGFAASTRMRCPVRL